MRFMLMVKATEYSEAGIKPSLEYKTELNEYNQSLARAGVLVVAEELQPSVIGMRIVYPLHGVEPTVQVGPFSNDQETIAGYTLIDVVSEIEASDWAMRMPVPKGYGIFEIEMRKFEDYPELKRVARTLGMEADLQDHLNFYRKQ
ncbi:YciI family protein [Paenibacillus endoradicis]|uniref:YciI family protein n=1 Tax=Paenibacillus endoradicis TaxID=2972487 RepID=UPI0021594CFD|nr:YciI family protein [Paenibacillus endoradicis]MCR8657706.1 YciI family protein [Paenibacillus endoradicis]